MHEFLNNEELYKNLRTDPEEWIYPQVFYTFTISHASFF